MNQSDSETMSEELRLVEALLFAASAPLDEASLRERLPEGTDVPALLDELARHYETRGVNVVRVASGWTLRTAPDVAPRLKLTQRVARKLSRAAIETLAVVAYHQPVTRAEIEAIRGVIISRGTLDTLMEAGWIAPKGRKQTVGRPVTWGTTEEFLLHFGLESIADLPGIDELRAAGLVGPRSVATLSETMGDAEARLPQGPAEVETDVEREPETEPVPEPEAEAAHEPEPEPEAEDGDEEREAEPAESGAFREL
jgi:segregation and condensation protein B